MKKSRKKQKVLVTGGAGFIGSNIVRILEARGDDVVILDNFSHSSYKNLEGCKADIICGDITDESIYAKLPKVDAVINEAAITDTTLLDDTKMMMVNYEGFRNVLNFCQKKKIKLVYASSAGVYGNVDYKIKEDDKFFPHNTYGFSKYMCDILAKKTVKPGSPLVVGLRYFNVYGPWEYHKGAAASMTYQLFNQMNFGKRPRVFKSGEQSRDFIYVKDVARITVEALDLKKSTILNVGTGKSRSFNDIIAALNKVMGNKLYPEYIDNPYADVYQNFTQADTTKLNKVKLAAKYSLEKGIEDYVKNYLV